MSADCLAYGTGRRKTSVARVRIFAGDGTILVNGRQSADYFHRPTLEMVIRQPLELTGTMGRYTIVVTLDGGGVASQAGARCGPRVTSRGSPCARPRARNSSRCGTCSARARDRCR